MKTNWSKWMVMIIASIMLSGFNINSGKAQGSVSLQVFYDELQPYGTWMDHGRYGYVWRPSVAQGFVPYATNGYWIQTEYGNTWVSDYEWGWAPFHYGRWFYDDFNGWIWIPDTEWAPAWVTWRSGGGYYGWAPLMPGFGINLSVNYYNRIPNRYWCFVPHRYITHRNVYRHFVPRPRVVNIINHTTIITNNYTDNRRRTYFTGPQRNEIERVNRQRVEVYSINDRNRPGRSEVGRGSVSLYRPEIDNSRESRSRAVPSSYARSERSGNNVANERRGSNAPNSQRESEVINRSSQSGDNNSPAQRSAPAQRMPERGAPVERSQGRESYSIPRTNDNSGKQQRSVEPTQRPRQTENNNYQQREPARRTEPQKSYTPTQRQSPAVQRSPSNSGQRQGSTVSPGNNRTASPQRGQQVQRSSSEQRSSQPARSRETTPRTRN